MIFTQIIYTPPPPLKKKKKLTAAWLGEWLGSRSINQDVLGSSPSGSDFFSGTANTEKAPGVHPAS